MWWTSWIIDPAEQAVQEQIAEMQATWQDPAAAWDDRTSESWDDAGAGATLNTTSVQIESVNNVSDSTSLQTSADGASGAIIKCIAFYSYTVKSYHWLIDWLIDFFSSTLSKKNWIE